VPNANPSPIELTTTSLGISDMTTSYLQKLRLFSRNARLYLLTWALLQFCWVGIYGTLFNLYLLRLGYDPAFIGLVGGIRMFAYAFFCLAAGALGARWGVRRMLIVGWGAMMLGMVLIPLASFMPRHLQPVWIVSTLTFAALGTGTYLSNGTPFLMDAADRAERDHVFSAWSAVAPSAGFCGSLVAGALPALFSAALRVPLDRPVPYRIPLMITPVFLIFGLWALFSTRNTVRGGVDPVAHDAGPLALGTIASLALIFMLQGAGVGVLFNLFSVYLDAGLRVPTVFIGTVRGLGQILCVPAALAAPFVIQRLGKGRTVALGLLGAALSLLPVALVPHWFAAGIGFLGFFSLSSIANPGLYTSMQEAVPTRQRPLMSGVIQMTEGVSFAAISLGGGYAMTSLGYGSPFLIAAVAVAIGALVAYVVFLRNPRRAPTLPSAQEPAG
jgi:MFS family permease